jgi:hypothetical protein
MIDMMIVLDIFVRIIVIIGAGVGIASVINDIKRGEWK